jgi:hypothetical protein
MSTTGSDRENYIAIPQYVRDPNLSKFHHKVEECNNNE